MSAAAAQPIEIVLFALECGADERTSLSGLLSADETRRAARFRFDLHRDRFVTGRARIRQILAARANCAAADIGFELNPHGKPSLARPESGRGIHFNASSSDSLGAIAIAGAGPLGLDIEKRKHQDTHDYDEIVASQFTPAENDWYRKQPAGDRYRVFFEFWTCKEAYLKALGIGLSGKLDSFSICLDGPEPHISHTDLEDGGQSGYYLHRPQIHDDFAACLAFPGGCRIELSHW